jgi:DNA-binding NarL/FixJ family response regulator
VLSASRSPEHLYRALRSGARGYVAKSGATTDLVRAVKAVLAGEYFVSPGIISGGVDHKMVAAIPKGRYERLSKREREVLLLVAAGSSSSDIAGRLSLSKKTIDTYRGRLMVKLGLRNRSELIRFAIESQILPT